MIKELRKVNLPKVNQLVDSNWNVNPSFSHSKVTSSISLNIGRKQKTTEVKKYKVKFGNLTFHTIVCLRSKVFYKEEL